MLILYCCSTAVHALLCTIFLFFFVPRRFFVAWFCDHWFKKIWGKRTNVRTSIHPSIHPSIECVFFTWSRNLLAFWSPSELQDVVNCLRPTVDKKISTVCQHVSNTTLMRHHIESELTKYSRTCLAQTVVWETKGRMLSNGWLCMIGLGLGSD